MDLLKSDRVPPIAFRIAVSVRSRLENRCSDSGIFTLIGHAILWPGAEAISDIFGHIAR